MGAEENLPLVRMLNEVLVMLGNAVMPVMAGGNLDLKPKMTIERTEMHRNIILSVWSSM